MKYLGVVKQTLKSLFGTLYNLSTNFLVCELVELMHQQRDKEYITLLNSLDIGNLSDDRTRMLQLR